VERRGKQAAPLKQAGAARRSAPTVFSNVSDFHTTSAEIGYDRQVLAAPAGGACCDPALSTGEAGIDAYRRVSVVKPPGESDGCRGSPGTFSPSYAYDLASS
jgi:endoglucanase